MKKSYSFLQEMDSDQAYMLSGTLAGGIGSATASVLYLRKSYKKMLSCVNNANTPQDCIGLILQRFNYRQKFPYYDNSEWVQFNPDDYTNDSKLGKQTMRDCFVMLVKLQRKRDKNWKQKFLRFIKLRLFSKHAFNTLIGSELGFAGGVGVYSATHT